MFAVVFGSWRCVLCSIWVWNNLSILIITRWSQFASVKFCLDGIEMHSKLFLGRCWTLMRLNFSLAVDRLSVRYKLDSFRCGESMTLFGCWAWSFAIRSSDQTSSSIRYLPWFGPWERFFPEARIKILSVCKMLLLSVGSVGFAIGVIGPRRR